MEKLLERYPNVTALRGREVIGFSHDDTGVAIEHAASSGTRYGQANATAEAPVGYGCDPRASLDAKTLARPPRWARGSWRSTPSAGARRAAP
jgi:hypothetical protein